LRPAGGRPEHPVKELGANGLVGLIALGFILWLFSNRSMS
jgi:hypothetical protein